MALEPRQQSKWDSLQDSGKSHIDKILSGKSTETDLQALSQLLSQQHELAGQIFDQGVEDAVQTANTIVKKLDDERIAQGKKPLTEKAQDRVFQKTFKDVMAQAVEDILGQVHDEFETQSRDIRDRVNDALTRIRDFQQKQPARSPDPGEITAGPAQRSMLDRMMGRGQRQDRQETGGRRSLMDRVFNRREDPNDRRRSTVFQAIKEATTGARDKISALYRRVSGRGSDGDEEKRATVWMRKLRSIFDPFKKIGSRIKGAAGGIAGLLGKIGLPLMAALMNPKLIESITDAVQKHLNFDQISKYVDNMWEEAKKMGSSALESMVDKIKAFFGQGKEKPKAAAAKKVDPLTQNTKTGALPKEITAKAAAAELPRREAQLEAAKLKLSQAKSAYAKSPTDANKRLVDTAQNTVNLLTMRVTQFKDRASEQKTEVTTPATSTASPSGEVSKEQANIAGSSTPNGEVPRAATTPTAEVPRQTSPVTPNQVRENSSAGPRSTEIVGETPKYTPGKSFDPEAKKIEEAKRKADKGSGIAQIGMGSFGFDSNDSAMNILNLGMLT